jgi:hypothetical protein
MSRLFSGNSAYGRLILLAGEQNGLFVSTV